MGQGITICIAAAIFLAAFPGCTSSHSAGQNSLSLSSSQGKALYDNNCSACHGPFEGSAVRDNATFDEIKRQIAQNSAMQKLAALSDDQIRIIAEALNASATGTDELTFANGNVTPAKSLQGAQFRIMAKYTSKKSYSGLTAKITLKNPTGATAATRVIENQTSGNGAPLIFDYTFTTSEASPTGQYKVIFEVEQNGQQVVAPVEANAFYLYPAIRIVAGSTMNYTDTLGRVWAPDSGFNGGQVLSPFPAVTQVSGTADSYIFNGLRWGEFSYKFTLPAGAKYKIHLHFAENFVTGPTQRIFSVKLNGTTVLPNLDIFAESGGRWRALNKTFSLRPAEDYIQLEFVRGGVQEPKAGAIAIVGDLL